VLQLHAGSSKPCKQQQQQQQLFLRVLLRWQLLACGRCLAATMIRMMMTYHLLC
jgi:hypothetical protein